MGSFDSSEEKRTAVVEAIVRAHGWSIAVTDGESGRARFEHGGCLVGESSSPTDAVIDLPSDPTAGS